MRQQTAVLPILLLMPKNLNRSKLYIDDLQMCFFCLIANSNTVIDLLLDVF